jgi:restriction endonuclease
MAAMEQFNTSEKNAMEQFDVQMKDSRDKFNSNMSFAVNQSNAVWRREVNTADTAIQNETNRINTQNLYNVSQNALNSLWQQYRDNASWNFQKSENALEREHTTAVNAMQIAAAESAYNKQQKDAMAKSLGAWLARII